MTIIHHKTLRPLNRVHSHKSETKNQEEKGGIQS